MACGIPAQPYLDFNTPGLQIQPDLKPEMVHHWSEDFHPLVLEGSKAMRWYRDFTEFRTSTLLKKYILLVQTSREKLTSSVT